MANIRRRRGKWQVQVRRHGCKSLYRTFHRKADAEAWARQMETEADRSGTVVDRRPLHTTTVDDLLKRYDAEVVPRKRGTAVEGELIKGLRRRSFAKLPLIAATVAVFSRYRDERLKEVKAGTVRREFDILHHVFEVARKDWGIPLAANPVAEVRRPAMDRPRDRRLADGEEQQLLAACARSRNRELLPVVVLAIETGMRRGEILSLEWQHIDLDTRLVYLPLTKNGDAREVPLSTRAAETLRSLSSGQARGAVFASSANAIRLAWEHARANAGLHDLRFHDLRHEAVSRFFEKGLNVVEASTISGHRDLRMLRRYTHLKAASLVARLD